METRFYLRTTQCLKRSPILRHLRHSHTSNKPPSAQAIPLGDYYSSLLTSPSPPPPQSQSQSTTPTSRPAFATSPATPSSTTDATSPSIIFSSRLSSPTERRSEIQKTSTLIAGVWVPARPDEPDDCCMSGCVNCVWDRYRDELEEWAGKKKEADAALMKEGSIEGARRRRKGEKKVGGGAGLKMVGGGEKEQMADRMDDDGGGNEGSWSTGLDADFMSEELFRGVPVGIREFMRQEKRLKEKHAKEGTIG